MVTGLLDWSRPAVCNMMSKIPTSDCQHHDLQSTSLFVPVPHIVVVPMTQTYWLTVVICLVGWGTGPCSVSPPIYNVPVRRQELDMTKTEVRPNWGTFPLHTQKQSCIKSHVCFYLPSSKILG